MTEGLRWGYLVLRRVWNHCTHLVRMNSTCLSILPLRGAWYIPLHSHPLQVAVEAELVTLVDTFVEFADSALEEPLHYCAVALSRFSSLSGLFYGFLRPSSVGTTNS